jgi:nucleotidyltransferase substrate binding protein (TIGR01987 family)
MNVDKLDLTLFRDALAELEKTHARAMTQAVKTDPELFPVYRSATVKAFEYTYGLAVKHMERFLEKYGTERGENGDINFRDMLRMAREYGLIRNIESWLNHRDCRNASSHGYQASIAERIFAAAPALIEDARFALAAMQRRIQEGTS